MYGLPKPGTRRQFQRETGDGLSVGRSIGRLARVGCHSVFAQVQPKRLFFDSHSHANGQLQ